MGKRVEHSKLREPLPEVNQRASKLTTGESAATARRAVSQSGENEAIPPISL
jgi:hypothetical protein